MQDFPKKDREIFSFFDGKKTVYVDPAEIEHSLVQARLSSEVDLDAIISNMGSKDPEIQYDALTKYVPFVNKVFGTKPLDRETGEGITMEESMNLIDSWSTWVESIKKNTEENLNSPILSPDTLAESSPTNNITECVPTSPESLESSPLP